METSEGDGNCFFRAVAQGLGLNQHSFHRELRTTATTYMTTHPQLFRHFFDGQQGIGEWSQSAQLQAYAQRQNR